MSDTLQGRAQEIFDELQHSFYRQAGTVFFALLVLQWVGAIIAALVVSPYTWIGEEQLVNQHVYMAVFLGGGIISLPLILIWYRPVDTATRHVVAVAHMLMIGMLVHVSGGRIETHFHYFVSLAFLGFYRDWKVIATATAVAGLEHLIRGIFWPATVYGVFTASPWRTLEHVAWVVFEDVVLLLAIARNRYAGRLLAERQAALEAVKERIEREVAARTEELRHEVAERRAAEERIQQVADELQRSNRELEHFASVASHDLQEPLRKIQAFGDRLRKKLGDAPPEGAIDDMERMRNAASRMQRLIEDLLVYSRVTTKAQPFVETDLDRVAREVLSDLEIRIETSGGRVDLGPLPVLMADPTQMRQLLQNLIANALKFKRPDVPPEITVRAVPTPDGGFELLISDNGIGFDVRYSEKIFGVFQRLHDQKQYEGTGIGLAVCKKIVERHGGTIEATSPGVGQGAVFRMLFPATANAHAASVATDPV